LEILVLRGGALGDFILLLPMLSALRRQIRPVDLEFWGTFPQAELARPELADTVTDLNSVSILPLFTPVDDFPRSLAERLGRVDLAVSYLFDPDRLIRRQLQKAGVRQIVQGPHRVENELNHAVFQLAGPLGQLGLSLTDPVPKLSGFSQIPSFPRIAIHLGSGSTRKNWPTESWVHLASEIEKLASELIVVTGQADRRLTEAFLERFRSPKVKVCDSLPLPALATELRHCRLFVGNDSGVPHLAAAVGTRTVALFGPTDPAIWRPLGAHVTVVQSRNGTMQGIEFDEVLQAVRESFEF
jgi:ADP-heptose:LPS heptosyltransferase